MSDFVFEQSALRGVMQITPKIIYGTSGTFIKNYESGVFENNGLEFMPTEEYRIIEDEAIFRGIHFQVNKPQKRIITVLTGKAFLTVVDLNKKSSEIGKYETFLLSEQMTKMVFVPEWYGVATISLINNTTISVMSSGAYYEQYSRGICYNDETLNIHWPTKNFRVFEKDKQLMTFKEYMLI